MLSFKIFLPDLIISSNKMLLGLKAIGLISQRELQYFTSSHPDNEKKSIVYSQALRLSRLCSFEEDFECHKSSMEPEGKEIKRCSLVTYHPSFKDILKAYC